MEILSIWVKNCKPHLERILVSPINFFLSELVVHRFIPFTNQRYLLDRSNVPLNIEITVDMSFKAFHCSFPCYRRLEVSLLTKTTIEDEKTLFVSFRD